MSSTLPPEHTPAPVTGEHPASQQNGEKLFWCYVKKWGPILMLLAAGGGIWQTIRSCTIVSAGIVGLQTTADADEFEAKTETAAEKNVEAHNNMWEAIGDLEAQSKEAVDNTNMILKGMPPSWKRRASRP
jgi:hypothetical protein